MRQIELLSKLKKNSQNWRIARHLMAGKSISPIEAQTVYSIFRLAARIEELRRRGFRIRTEMREDDSRKRYARYWLCD